MMYLTKSQMDKMDALFDAQELPDPENGEEIYATHYYFEPASPEILDRIY